MYKIPIAQPDMDDYFTFKIRDLEFHADIILFACFSELFQEDISLIEQKEYTVKSSVSKESFQDFLDGCQGKAFFIKTSNVYDLNLLCKEFQTTIFDDKVKEFFFKNRDEALVEKMKYLIQDENSFKDEDTLKTITNEISLSLDHMTEELRKELFNIRLTDEVIEQFLSIPNRQFKFDSLIFANIPMRKEKSDLLKHIDLRALSMEEVIKFADSEALPDSYESKRVFPYLKELITSVKQQKMIIDKLQEQVLKQVNGLNNQIDDIYNSTRSMQDQINGCFDEIGSMQKDIKVFDIKASEINSKYEGLNEELGKMDSEIYFPLELKFNQLEKKIMRSIIINNPLDGIFHNLYSRNDTNPAGIDVEIITPSSINPDFKPSNLLEYDDEKIDDCYYHKLQEKDKKSGSADENNWIEFDFGEKSKVELIGYTIRTNSFSETFSHPKKFEIQGKNDSEKWETIDKRENADELNGAKRIHTYLLSKYSKPFRRIRYLQLDTHFRYKDKDKIMALSAIELHGERKFTFQQSE